MLNLNDIISVLETQKSEAERKSALIAKIIKSIEINAVVIDYACKSFLNNHRDVLLQYAGVPLTDSITEDINTQTSGDYYFTITIITNIILENISQSDVDFLSESVISISSLIDNLLSYEIFNIK